MKTKAYFLPGFVVMLALLLGACDDDDEGNMTPETGEIAVNMIFPTDWDRAENFTEQVALVGYSPLEGPNDPFQENVNIVTERADGFALDTYYEATLEALTFLNDYRLLSSKDTVVNSYEAKKIIFTASSNAGQFQFMDFIFYQQDHGIVITCTARQDTFADYEAEFLQIVGTFEVQ